MRTEKILCIDFEVTPAKVWTWGMFEQNVIKVIEQPFMLSGAYQWLGEKTQVIALPDFPLYKHDKKNDKLLIQKLREVLNEADVVLGQNSDKFDIKWFNTRCVVHHIPPPSPYKTIDTLKISKSKFYWLSNKLDFVADRLGHGRKVEHEGFPLWEKCIEGDMKAWKKMKKYNRRDVDLTAGIYKDYLPWIQQKQPIWSSDPCPSCGDTRTVSNGYKERADGKRFQRKQCRGCGHYFIGKQIISKP